MQHRDKMVQCTPITHVEISPVNLAIYLAALADKDQAEFFNEFDIQLSRLCEINGGSKPMQLSFVRKYLTPDAMYTLLDLGTPDE